MKVKIITKRVYKTIELAELDFIPTKDIKNGLEITFDRDTLTETNITTGDIIKGQKTYELPNTKRKIVKVRII